MMEAVAARWMEEDDQQVAPLKNVIPLFLLLRARALLGFRVLLLLFVVTIP